MTMTTRQKILLPLTLLAFGVLCWQVMVVFFPTSWSRLHLFVRPSAVAKSALVAHDAALGATAASQSGRATQSNLDEPLDASLGEPGTLAGPSENTTVASAMQGKSAKVSQQSGDVLQATHAETLPMSAGKPSSGHTAVEGMAPITVSQQQYMQLANAYQLAKLQRMLAEEEAAIAQAKLKLQDLGKQVHGSKTGVWSVAQRQAHTQPVYQLVYLDGQQGAEWAATLAYNGQYIAVQPEDTLANGDKVLRIDHHGVLLGHDGQEHWIAFHPSGTIG